MKSWYLSRIKFILISKSYKEEYRIKKGENQSPSSIILLIPNNNLRIIAIAVHYNTALILDNLPFWSLCLCIDGLK